VHIIPFVMQGLVEMHARILATIIRLSSMPVGVGHHGHCIAVRISSPDKRGLTTRVYALSCRPDPRMCMTASGQRCLSLNIYNIIGTDYVAHSEVEQICSNTQTTFIIIIRPMQRLTRHVSV